MVNIRRPPNAVAKAGPDNAVRVGDGAIQVKAGRINRSPEKVYDDALVGRLDFSSPKVKLRGNDLAPVRNKNSRTGEFFKDDQGRDALFLKEGVQIGDIKIGGFLGKGSVSDVYSLKGDPSKVVKVVPLGVTRGRFSGQDQILDQQVGRQILLDVRAKSPNADVFDVAKQRDFKIVEMPDGKKLAVSVEDNIRSPVIDPATGRQKLGEDGQPLMAGDAAERVKLRQRELNRDEELTINLAIRDLNKQGIVWTDHKLANFDVMPDPNSKTGYKVLFFDLDAFRPVKGADATTRFKTARKLQRAYDLNDGTGTDPVLRDADMYWDLTAFGPSGQKLVAARTPRANLGRKDLAFLNGLDDVRIQKEVEVSQLRSRANRQIANTNPAVRPNRITNKAAAVLAGGAIGVSGAVAAGLVTPGVVAAIEEKEFDTYYSQGIEAVSDALGGGR